VIPKQQAPVVSQQPAEARSEYDEESDDVHETIFIEKAGLSKKKTAVTKVKAQIEEATLPQNAY